MKQQKNWFPAATTLGFSFIDLMMQVQQNQTSNCWRPLLAPSCSSKLSEVEVVALIDSGIYGTIGCFESFMNHFQIISLDIL